MKAITTGLLISLIGVAGCSTINRANRVSGVASIWGLFSATYLMKNYPETIPYLKPCMDAHPKTGEFLCPHLVRLTPAQVHEMTTGSRW